MTETPEQKMVRENRMLFCKVGSHMYGTDTPESDIDCAGIFLPNPDYIIGLKRCEQVEFKTNPSDSGKRNSKEDRDEVIYSFPKYLHLVSQCNPNILELLWSTEPYLNAPPFWKPFGEALVANRRRFLSQRARKTFLGYAYSQREKLLVKKDRLDAIRKAREEFNEMETSWVGGTRSLSGKPLRTVIEGKLVVVGNSGSVYRIFENGTECEFVERKLNEMESEYGLRTKSIEQHGFDVKFGSHLIRLLREGLDILEGRELRFPLPYAQELRDIRLGRVPLEELLRLAESLMKKAETVSSKLPEHCDMEWLNDFQVRMLKDFWNITEGKTNG